MSSDEGDASVPVLPKDSDRGSSVSSELQDEYEELLRYAVVTPKFEADGQRHSQLSADSRIQALADDARSQLSTGSVSEREDGRLSNRELTSARVTPFGTGPRQHFARSEAEEIPIANPSDVESERGQTPSERSRCSSLDPLLTATTELFVTEENMGRMENILDTWSGHLKVNVMMELRKWKLAFVEQHKREVMKERQRHASLTVGLTAEMDSLKELLHTYETSNQRKDEVISNLTQGVERQRERLELMRTFTHWRQQQMEAREEAHWGKVAEQHYQLQLKRKVWAGWHSLIQADWRQRVERACQARAEEVCVQLSADYEAKMAEQAEALERARVEIQRLHAERERFEESMKKAFMRGVCALNLEAMNMFHGGEGRLDHDPPHRDEPESSSSVRFQPPPTSSTRFSPVHFESPLSATPIHSEAENMFGSGAGPSTTSEGHPSNTTVNVAFPPGGTASRLTSSRVVTSGQQKATKTITARITGRSDMGAKASRVSSSLQVMGVAPPMSSIIVERHHPVTQLTVGQATAAKFPRSAQQSIVGNKGPSHNQRTFSQIHSIKVVE